MLGIGHKLKNIREDKKVSQQDVAYRLNISQKTYSNIEANKSTPSLTQLFKLAEFLEFNIMEFLNEQQVIFNKLNKLYSVDDIKNYKDALPKKLLEQYEYRIKEKEELILLLKEKITSLQTKTDKK